MPPSLHDCNILRLYAVAKPLVADGSAKAHAMSLAYDKSCLTQLDPPLMLQEFVNHGMISPIHYGIVLVIIVGFFNFKSPSKAYVVAQNVSLECKVCVIH